MTTKSFHDPVLSSMKKRSSVAERIALFNRMDAAAKAAAKVPVPVPRGQYRRGAFTKKFDNTTAIPPPPPDVESAAPSTSTVTVAPSPTASNSKSSRKSISSDAPVVVAKGYADSPLVFAEGSRNYSELFRDFEALYDANSSLWDSIIDSTVRTSHEYHHHHDPF